MTVLIRKSVAEGRISVPSSKSDSHRAIICAALCNNGQSLIRGVNYCDDVLTTIEFLNDLGANISFNQDTKVAKVWGFDPKRVKPMPVRRLNCRESGSTLRFLLPLLWLTGNEVIMRVGERLITRPLDVYEQIAEEKGFKLEKQEDMIFTRGMLCAGEYRIPGNVSSQFISGLIFGLSLLEKDSKIILTTPLESKGYVDLTIKVLKDFGVGIIKEDLNTIHVKGGQNYKCCEYSVEGDWSSAAFLDALNLIGGKVEILGLNEDSLHPDKVYKKHFENLTNGFCQIDLKNCPDLGPILFSIAALNNGARFIGTRRLKQKESDRVYAMKSELEKFGAEIVVEDDAVEIKKAPLHTPKDKLCGHGDHRIVMALAVLCTAFGGTIEGSEAVTKSYPNFFDNLRTLGINLQEI